MYKRYLAVAIIVVLAIAVPLSIAALTDQKNFTVNGTGHYPDPLVTPVPTASASPTPTPTATSTVAFSLSFQNGTSVPATFLSAPDTLFFQTGNGAPPMGYSPFLELNITNTGNLPMNVAITFPNPNFPSGMTYNFWSDMQDTWGFRNPNGNERPLGTLAVGQSVVVNIFGYVTSNHARDGSAFSYSLDVAVAVTQA